METIITDWLARARQALTSRASRERTPYVQLLEENLALERDEVSRLRAENRALVNSLLGTAGVPPIETGATPPMVMPVRRRSWPQISTAREMEAARQARARERQNGKAAQ